VSYRHESLSLFSCTLVWLSYSSILTSKLPVILVHTWLHWNQQKSVKCLKKAEAGIRLLFFCDKMFFSTSYPSISLAYCTLLNGVVLHYQWKIKPLHHWKKCPSLCVFSRSVFTVINHIFSVTSAFKFLYWNRDKLFYGCSGMHLAWVYINLA